MKFYVWQYSFLNAFSIIFLIRHLTNNYLENINESIFQDDAYVSVNVHACVYRHVETCMYMGVYVFLLSTYLEGYFMKIVTTGSIPCFLLLYRRFLNITINFWYIMFKERLFKDIFMTFWHVCLWLSKIW